MRVVSDMSIVGNVLSSRADSLSLLRLYRYLCIAPRYTEAHLRRIVLGELIARGIV